MALPAGRLHCRKWSADTIHTRKATQIPRNLKLQENRAGFARTGHSHFWKLSILYAQFHDRRAETQKQGSRNTTSSTSLELTSWALAERCILPLPQHERKALLESTWGLQQMPGWVWANSVLVSWTRQATCWATLWWGKLLFPSTEWAAERRLGVALRAARSYLKGIYWDARSKLLPAVPEDRSKVQRTQIVAWETQVEYQETKTQSEGSVVQEQVTKASWKVSILCVFHNSATPNPI